MLVEDTTRTSRAMVSKVVKGVSDEAIAKMFTSIVLKDKIRMAVRFVTLRGVGGVLLSNEIDLKSRQPFIDML